MEILEKGKLPQDEEHIGTCFNCKCRVKFKRKEGKTTYDQRDGNFVSIKCPTEGCDHTITSTIR